MEERRKQTLSHDQGEKRSWRAESGGRSEVAQSRYENTKTNKRKVGVNKE